MAKPKPGALSFQHLTKQASIYLQTGEALAWALLGCSVGQVLGMYWPRAVAASAFSLGPTVLDPVLGTIAVAGYLLIAQKPKLHDCLRVAHIMFIQDLVNVREYRTMRSNCLKRWGGI